MYRRFAALLSILLLVQLTLAGSSAACVAHEADGDPASLDGGSMSHASPASAGQEAPASGSSAPDGCDLPWALGTCATMASCAPCVLPSAPVRPATAIGMAIRAAARPLLAPPTPVRVPELPPPRA